jgi:hypothetical protein
MAMVNLLPSELPTAFPRSILALPSLSLGHSMTPGSSNEWSPTGKGRGPLANATWGDIPRHTPGRAGHTMAHSSSRSNRGVSCCRNDTTIFLFAVCFSYLTGVSKQLTFSKPGLPYQEGIFKEGEELAVPPVF